MKFKDFNGREHSIDLRPSRWKRKATGDGRGVYQSHVGDLLAAQYPGEHILEEFPCVGETGYLDFFLPSRMLAVEVQGAQHYSFNKFFHRTRADFLEQKKRDRKKAEWCEANGIRLVIIDYDEPDESVMAKIKPAVEG
jgi:hypothetical protein